MNMILDRTHYIPAGAMKVADKHSDGVVYLYTNASGQPCGVAFHGRASKPDWRFRFRSQAECETTVRNFFGDRQRRAAAKAAERARPHKLEVGHVLVASWGYDQTNVNFYQVTALAGARTVELRALRSIDAGSTGTLSGYVLPALDDFAGEPKRRRADGYGGVKVSDCQRATLWHGRPVMWTGYH